MGTILTWTCQTRKISPDGAEANEQCDGILGAGIATTIRTPMSMTAMTVFPTQSCLLAKGGLWKQVYASVLPDLPELPSSRADERDGWYANQYYARYMDDQALELLHEMTEVSYLQRTRMVVKLISWKNEAGCNCFKALHKKET
ncbi:hypothetical protein MRX96_037968 [Rhipicephalus microplus]